MDLIDRIEALFMRRGRAEYLPSDELAAPQAVTALAHALQCAQLAEWAHADHELVAASLLHDLGQLIDAEGQDPLRVEAHEGAALALLGQGFGPGVLEPIRLHVQAKRYLVAVEAGYAATLSPSSRLSLSVQGGPMDVEAQRRFLAQPYAREALQLRRWDDLARLPGRRTPPLSYYLDLLRDLLGDMRTPRRLAIA